MDDAVSVQVLDGREHLAHHVGCVSLSELLGGDDTIEELAPAAVLHDDVHVAMIDVALIELHDVGVVHLLQNGQLFLQQPDVLRDILPKD